MIVSLLVTIVSVLFLAGLYFKFKRLQKYLDERRKRRNRYRRVPIGTLDGGEQPYINKILS